MIALICAYCGKEFKTLPCRVRSGRTACSKTCRYLAARKTAEQTFNRFVVKAQNSTDCWGWNGCIDTYGYGQMSHWKNGARFSEHAHRVSYRLHVGEIPSGLWVLHRCDNRLCCNPAHLFLGTSADNTADRHAKGRSKPPINPAIGAAVGTAKLTEADVLTIRASAASARALGRMLGVDKTTIRAIQTRKLWKHIP